MVNFYRSMLGFFEGHNTTVVFEKPEIAVRDSGSFGFGVLEVHGFQPREGVVYHSDCEPFPSEFVEFVRDLVLTFLFLHVFYRRDNVIIRVIVEIGYIEIGVTSFPYTYTTFVQ